MDEGLKLRENDHVAVIGAGPAGSIFAYYLLSLARKEGLGLRVTIYDPRDCTQSGPSGCGKCAGVINGSLWQRLQRIGIDLNKVDNLIQSRLRGYLWSTPAGGMRIELPQGWQPCRTVFRGGGPLFGDLDDDNHVGFDEYLLDKAQEQGAEYQRKRVVDIGLPDLPSGAVRLTLEKGGQRWQEQAQLLVGAFGLDTSTMEQFERLGIGYRPGRYVQVAQVELVRRHGVAPCATDDYIRVYNISGQRVRQLVLTPKGNYATLTMLAPHNLHAEDIEAIRKTTEVENILQSGWDWPDRVCQCLPLLENRGARNFYADRIVLIGDAACCRFYKNGLESALRSAEMAAETALHRGISRRCFRRWYFPRVWQEIIHDNIFGRVLLSAHDIISSHTVLMRLAIQTRAEMTHSEILRLHDTILWDMLTGNRSYRHIFLRIVQPYMLLEVCMHLSRAVKQWLGQHILRFWRRGLRRWTGDEQKATDGVEPDRMESQTHRKVHHPRDSLVMRSGLRVSIIGAGPAGTSCAISLLQSARQRNIEVEVTIHESKDFAAAAAMYHPSNVPFYDKRINQCIGVLSPPICEILTERLKIDFPDHLVQKYITGYVLHGRDRTIELDELYGSSYALRRITFDDYMMRCALEHGAQLKFSVVTALERRTAVRAEASGAEADEVFRIITADSVVEADVVVGAFGMDQKMADIFERCFGYRRPEYMQTIITKRHPSVDFLKQFGLRIHAFVPPMRAVEFGAITPKLNHLSINIAGRNVDDETMHEFLEQRQVARLLPQEYDEKGTEIFYPGCFPTSPAGNIFADRMVVIGDASGMLRPFKGKGINAAIISGIAAAQVIVRRGFSAQRFHRYYLPVFREVTEDLMYARTARMLTNLLANYGCMDVVLELAKSTPSLRQALAEAVSGACSYKKILHRLTNERIVWRSGGQILKKLVDELMGG